MIERQTISLKAELSVSPNLKTLQMLLQGALLTRLIVSLKLILRGECGTYRNLQSILGRQYDQASSITRHSPCGCHERISQHPQKSFGGKRRFDSARSTAFATRTPSRTPTVAK